MSLDGADSVNTYLGVPLYELTDKQANRALLSLVLELRHDVARLDQRMGFHMATLEEATAALAAAVDRIGGVITLVEQGRADAVAAQAAAQAALDAANVADATEDADFQAQINALTEALAAANDALSAQIASADAASAAITAQVDELNALPVVDVPPVDEPPVG